MTNSARRLFLPGLILFSLIAACADPTEQDLLQDARARYAADDAAGAMIQLKNLLRAHPNNREARLFRGEVALSLENGMLAEKDFLKAEELGVDRADIVVKLGKSMMLQYAFERVIAEIHGGTATDQRTRIDVLLLRGNAYLSLRRLENAEKAFREVLALSDNSADARVGLGRVALAQDNIGAALTEMARAVSLGAESSQVWVANGEVQLQTGNPVEARESFKRAIELRPITRLYREDFAALNGLFQAHLQLDEVDEALSVAELALKIDRGHPLAHYIRGQHAMHTGDVEAATTYLLRTVGALPRHVGALSLLGSISLQQGKLDEADLYLRQAMELDRQNPRIRMQLAQTMLRLNEGSDALELLTPVMRSMGEVPELLALAGRAKAAARGSTDWLSYFEQAAAAEPSDMKWQFELAQAYIAAGEADKSLEILKRIPDSIETTERRDLIMIEALRRTERLDAALELADEIWKRKPDDIGVQLMVGQLHLANGNLDAARKHLVAVRNTDRNNIPAMLTLGQVEIRSANLDAAEALFRAAYVKQPDYLPTITLLVSLAQSRGNDEEAIEWLEAARLTNPLSVMPRVGLVALYLMQDKVSLAYGLAQEAVKLKPNDSRALAALGLAQVRREEYRLAIKTLEKAALAAPKSGMIRFQLSKAYHGINDTTAARHALKKAIELSPWRANYAVAAAKLDLSLGYGAAAAQVAEDMIQAHADNPAGYALLGKALVLEKRYAEAASVLADAVRLGQHEQYVMQQYDALVKAGDDSPHQVLLEWLKESPGDWRVRALLAQDYHFDGESELAIEQYERVRLDNPDNAAVLNNLAWLYSDRDTAKALELAKTVHRLQPHVGTFTDTLGWMHVLRGDL
ncbi:MAG: PEP-CTERM system TPR-repeat protein PrsT, partial [Gammaproteobacteria bacterium]|nr:PEP-CTERM system TPR-repeat protein PrsT [Gammaproteobacteria bacterium]